MDGSQWGLEGRYFYLSPFWIQVCYAHNHAVMPWAVFTTQPKVNSAEIKKPCFKSFYRYFQKQKDIWKCSFQLSFEMNANSSKKP